MQKYHTTIAYNENHRKTKNGILLLFPFIYIFVFSASDRLSLMHFIELSVDHTCRIKQKKAMPKYTENMLQIIKIMNVMFSDTRSIIRIEIKDRGISL